jgi:hypothetical protein
MTYHLLLKQIKLPWPLADRDISFRAKGVDLSDEGIPNASSNHQL